MVAPAPRPSGGRYAAAAEACREARVNRLRRAGWRPGQEYPEPDDQTGRDPLSLSSDSTPDSSTELD